MDRWPGQSLLDFQPDLFGQASRVGLNYYVAQTGDSAVYNSK